MTPSERITAIYAATEEFHDRFAELKVESSIVCVSIDEAPITGYGTSSVQGNTKVLLEMLANAVKALPTGEFFYLMSAMATHPTFAANRGEYPQDAPAIKPDTVN